MQYLWVKWEAGDGGPCSKRFGFFKVRRMGRPRLAQGLKYVVLRSPSPRRGCPGAVELQIEEGADIEAAAKAFVEAEGGELSEFWIEVEHEQA